MIGDMYCDNAVSGIKTLPLRRKQPNPLWSNEAFDLLKELSYDHRQIATVYLKTGMGRREFAKLLWKDVDFFQQKIVVRGPKIRRD